jgi:hypothetical protein
MRDQVVVIALSLLFASPLLAAEDRLPPPFSDEYLVSRAPPEFGLNPPPGSQYESEGQVSQSPAIEKRQSIDGTTYTPITPIYTGQNNNVSYIRFINGGFTNNSVTHVTFVGATTGTIYGSVLDVTASPSSSPQFSYAQLFNAAHVPNPTIGNEGVTMYLKNGDPYSGFQHVIFNSVSGFFENVSNCLWLNGSNYHPLNQRVTNVHTTVACPL